ncbi:hypothetical protein EJ08DRAFT_701437 [Tothia fuscella]|uniref:Uncharacterized protein n=1 Tax=Tothia fuscella TaxID=1048955 RepID=A0A9P4NI97_9PEZI|nr:hypothetical protein EJ08DRAFT_701437 [Tothia fuscella]
MASSASISSPTLIKPPPPPPPSPKLGELWKLLRSVHFSPGTTISPQVRRWARFPHPVVILEVDEQTQTANVMGCRSWSGNGLAHAATLQHLAATGRSVLEFVPIYPALPHPLNGTFLSPRHFPPDFRGTWVDVAEVFVVQFCMLRWQMFELQGESLGRLREWMRANFDNELQVDCEISDGSESEDEDGDGDEVA